MDVELVLEFFRKNRFSEAELALKDDIREKRGQFGSFDFEKFVFPVNPPLPPVKVPGSSRRRRAERFDWGGGSGFGSDSTDDEEFVSLGSSSSYVYSSEFTNPYALPSAAQVDSDSSSDRLSQFGTARDYHEFDMQTDLWYFEKEGQYPTPSIGGFDPFGPPSEDKFVMTSEMENQSNGPRASEKLDHLENTFQFNRISADDDSLDPLKDYCHLDDRTAHPGQGVKWDLCGHIEYENSILDPCSKSFDGAEAPHGTDSLDLDESAIDDFRQLKIVERPTEKDGKGPAWKSEACDITYVAPEQCFLQYDYEADVDREEVRGLDDPSAAQDEQESAGAEEFPFWETTENEYEVFDLRIIHRKNRTGFEETKDLPIVMNTIVAGRYYVTEYLGSAAFSKVVQAHDIHTGVDVCLKIIKNDKDFFDQSLDEIKLLKYVNKHDPADDKHILRLYDYFYHQEHLFIVCELLRANLYEFQKFNLESGGEPYFTMSRLQAITCQCLEALNFLHQLGVIHCDLKPENVLVKSYSRCEIKIIDLGSSCFETDNLCLYVQSRSYRAPEVILGLPYGPKIDIWSLGCILAELCSGEVLFPNDAVVILLARMIAVVGPIDLEMLLRGKEVQKYFTKEFDLFHINEDTNQVEYIVPESSSLEYHLPVSDDEFIDFMKCLLQINPRKRPTAEEALMHPWLSKQY